MKPLDHDFRMDRVRVVLDGLSVGDAFGQQFFSPYIRDTHLRQRSLPFPKWSYTDDTAMSLAIVEVLDQTGEIDQNELARCFTVRYGAEPDRGYGAGVRKLLSDLARGGEWRSLSHTLFKDNGSFGNGAAMRVAPVGAYFCDDIPRVVREARRSAEITHAHEEGIAGAIAVAVATAWVICNPTPDPGELLSTVHDFTPPSAVRDGIMRASRHTLDSDEFAVANDLGNGSQVTAADTVPFCLWCAAAHLTDYPEAMWTAVNVDGDRDTNCAIVGGVVAAAMSPNGVPEVWRRSRESLWLRSDR